MIVILNSLVNENEISRSEDRVHFTNDVLDNMCFITANIIIIILLFMKLL